MFRLFKPRRFKELWQCRHVSISGVGRRQMCSLFPRGLDFHHQTVTVARLFHTGWPRQAEKLDLDTWKSVMKTQTASFEQQTELEDDDQDDSTKQEGSTSLDTLEAARNMVSMWRHACKKVPEVMTDEELNILMGLTTQTSRYNYLKRLAHKEQRKMIKKEKKQQKREEREALLEHKQEQEEEEEEEKDTGRSYFCKVWNKRMDHHYDWMGAQTMQFGHPLVLDMSYDGIMNSRELVNTVKQLQELLGLNRRAADPYHLHLCNLHPEGEYQRQLLMQYGANGWNRLPVTITAHNYVDVFPHESLVYLTADSPNVLHTYDHTKVYIIGALVDRLQRPGLSLANAKRLKLNTARLPLDQYLHWGLGNKNLTLDQMICIMLTVKDTGKWEEALKFVPGRKHEGFHKKPAQGKITKPFINYSRSLKFSKQNEKRTFASGDKKEFLKDSFSVRSRNQKNPETLVRASYTSNARDGKGLNKRKHWMDE